MLAGGAYGVNVRQRSCCCRPQEKGYHPKPDSVRAGTFSIPIVGILNDGEADQNLVKKYQKQLAESLEPRGGSKETAA